MNVVADSIRVSLSEGEAYKLGWILKEWLATEAGNVPADETPAKFIERHDIAPAIRFARMLFAVTGHLDIGDSVSDHVMEVVEKSLKDIRKRQMKDVTP